MVANNILVISRQLSTNNLFRVTSRLRSVHHSNVIKPEYGVNLDTRSIHTDTRNLKLFSLRNKPAVYCFTGVPEASRNRLFPENYNYDHNINLISKRFKRTRGRTTKQESDDDEEDDDDDDSGQENPLLMDEFADRPTDGSQRIVIEVNSLRLDALAKTAFSVTRQKIEEHFYKGDLYINGERAAKKSQDLHLGDEIDLVKNVNTEDRNKIDIKRVQIIRVPDKATEHGRMKVTIDRWLDLTIDNPETRNE